MASFIRCPGSLVVHHAPLPGGQGEVYVNLPDQEMALVLPASPTEALVVHLTVMREELWADLVDVARRHGTAQERASVERWMATAQQLDDYIREIEESGPGSRVPRSEVLAQAMEDALDDPAVFPEEHRNELLTLWTRAVLELGIWRSSGDALVAAARGGRRSGDAKRLAQALGFSVTVMPVFGATLAEAAAKGLAVFGFEC